MGKTEKYEFSGKHLHLKVNKVWGEKIVYVNQYVYVNQAVHMQISLLTGDLAVTK